MLIAHKDTEARRHEFTIGLSTFYTEIVSLAVMQNKEEILMDEAYKAHLQKTYIKPLIRQTILLSVAAFLLLLCFLTASLENSVKYSGGRWGSRIDNSEYTMNYSEYIFSNVVTTIILSLVVYLFFKNSKKSKYYRDYKFGFIVKEKVAITSVFETPAGINIYWIDSDSILNFTAEPYQTLKQGDQLNIYYLKHLRELVNYELVNDNLALNSQR